MATHAYVLVETCCGEVTDALSEIKKIAGVKAADATTGPFDIIARVEAGSVDALGKAICSKIQAVPGVKKTLTNIVVKL